ncbi:MAG: helix-turn-helix domain-containing protein [Candidatus Solibacter usitatus]|nr:helix-turn-helix domain-containing protein [Candidatus Solibacter usitatus]
MIAARAPGTECGDRLLRAREVMQVLGVSRATAYRLMNDGTLPVVRFGGTNHRSRTMLRVRESALLQWMEQNEAREGCTWQPAT